MTQDSKTQMSQKLRSVGWVGAGKMGAPMIRNLLDKGVAVGVTDPQSSVVDALKLIGAKAAPDLSAHEDADIVFSTLPNDAALLEVVAGTHDTLGIASILRSGAVFVEMSTVSPKCSETVSKSLSEKGILYLRAPLSGSTALAESAALTVLASGDKMAWDIALPYLEHLSARQFHLGTGEEARYMKLVLNTLVGATSAIMAEALALGESGGLSRDSIMKVVGESVVASALLKYKTNTVVSNDFTPAFSVEQMIKDFTLITDAARAHDLSHETTALILQQYRDAAASGLKDDDFFALVKWRSGHA